MSPRWFIQTRQFPLQTNRLRITPIWASLFHYQPIRRDIAIAHSTQHSTTTLKTSRVFDKTKKKKQRPGFNCYRRPAYQQQRFHDKWRTLDHELHDCLTPGSSVEVFSKQPFCPEAGWKLPKIEPAGRGPPNRLGAILARAVGLTHTGQSVHVYTHRLSNALTHPNKSAEFV